MSELRAPIQAQLVQWLVGPGDDVRAGDVVAILEAMKMEHEVRAAAAGQVRQLFFAAGETVDKGDVLMVTQPATAGAPASPSPDAARTAAAETPGGTSHRPDLQRTIDRHALVLDTARTDAVARRHQLGQRTARENIADLCDAGSFIEYGALAVAAQRSRRSAEDLMRNTPADGMVTGVGNVNGGLFGPERSRAVVMAYDATVLAGTQGMRNHQKTDRMLGIALGNRLPVVLFAEGGGGRPGDTDLAVVAGLHVTTFASYARMNGVAPVIGIVSGRCFAGNAALPWCKAAAWASSRPSRSARVKCSMATA
jgi:multidrug efflux pump subunit AcrA (membrane-fusion protein)